MKNIYELPLKGLKVVELANFVAAPSAGRVLSDFGADVIKIESLSGDKLRDMSEYEGIVGEEDKNPIFTAINSGKRLIALNIKAEEGKEALIRLLTDADIFISNIRMKSLIKLGLNYESLSEKFPKLIYAHFSGYGLKGPEAEKPGFDTTAFWAKNGALCSWSQPGAFPIRPTLGFGDITAGTAFLSGILIALQGREKTEHGSFLSSSLLSSSIWCSSLGLISQQSGIGNPKINDPLRPADPFCHFYKCADDRYISISDNNYSDDLEKFAGLFGAEYIINDERFSSLAKLHETDAVKELTEHLNRTFLMRNSDQWLEFLENNNVACEKLESISELVADPQAIANGYVEERRFKDDLHVLMPQMPIGFNNYKSKPYSSESRLGKDTFSVFKMLGYSETEIKELREKKIIK